MQPSNIQRFNEHSLKNVVGLSNNHFTDYNSTLASFNISVQLDRFLLSKYQLLVYAILPSGDIAADTKEIELGPCLLNKVYRVMKLFLFIKFSKFRWK